MTSPDKRFEKYVYLPWPLRRGSNLSTRLIGNFASLNDYAATITEDGARIQ